MIDEMNFKNKQGLIEQIDAIKDELYVCEISLELVLNHYVYGGFNNTNRKSTLPDMSQQEIYWFVLEKLVAMVNQGSIHAKWLIGRELMQGWGFVMPDKALGRFLVAFAAHEGCFDACHDMARQYHHLNYGDRDIVIYWQHRADSDEAVGAVGEPLPLFIKNDDAPDGSLRRSVHLSCELSGEWDGYADLPKPICPN